MIQLQRHIEILLLGHDCVIIPGFGGFIAHHVDARYDADDRLWLPPYRTLGFNLQLTLNDSLLVQSYVEAYDMSYPDALRQIESEVEELKDVLSSEGAYEMDGVGTLHVNFEGNIEFEPCEAGILSPEVGATAEIRSTPYFSQNGRNSSFSSNGKSSTKSPSTPASPQADMNFSEP